MTHPSTPPGPRRPMRAARLTGLMAALAVVPAWACGGMPWSSSEPEPDAREVLYAEGVAALDAGDFAGAEDRFRRLAARCESGDEGRSALLALVATELDLRNEESDPDEAARLAAIHLSVPDAPAAEQALARTLYLLALYRGAEPIRGPADLDRPRARRAPVDGRATDGAAAADADTVPVATDSAVASADGTEARADSAAADTLARPDAPAVAADPSAPAAAPDSVEGPLRAAALEPARRFSRCELTTEVAWMGVPDYPGLPPVEWARSDTVVVVDDRGGAGQVAALQARVRALEAELERIRKVLKGGGGEVPDPRP